MTERSGGSGINSLMDLIPGSGLAPFSPPQMEAYQISQLGRAGQGQPPQMMGPPSIPENVPSPHFTMVPMNMPQGRNPGGGGGRPPPQQFRSVYMGKDGNPYSGGLAEAMMRWDNPYWDAKPFRAADRSSGMDPWSLQAGMQAPSINNLVAYGGSPFHQVRNGMPIDLLKADIETNLNAISPMQETSGVFPYGWPIRGGAAAGYPAARAYGNLGFSGWPGQMEPWSIHSTPTY
jgi:hypothetical protein